MNSKTKSKFKCFLLISILIYLIGCQGKVQLKEECLKYENETYKETTDTLLIKEAFEYQEILLERFGESSVKELNHEAYHFQFYSSHGYGKSIKFENKIGGSSISVKCKSKKDWFEECKEYQIGIGKDEWKRLKEMIYEFNFWTEEDIRGNKDVLDGYVYFLEGKRPEARKCNKKVYKLVGRDSPRHDKMGALCESILEYEDQLAFRYFQTE